MALSQTLATSFKVEILDGIHNFGTGVVRATTAADTFKIALYTSLASLDASTTVYTTTAEVTGTGYTAGGSVLVPIAPASNTTANTAYVSFNNVTWSPAAFTCRGALIYNSTTGSAVCVLNFGSDKTCSNSFTVTFPADDASNAVIRFS